MSQNGEMRFVVIFSLINKIKYYKFNLYCDIIHTILFSYSSTYVYICDNYSEHRWWNNFTVWPALRVRILPLMSQAWPAFATRCSFPLSKANGDPKLEAPGRVGAATPKWVQSGSKKTRNLAGSSGWSMRGGRCHLCQIQSGLSSHCWARQRSSAGCSLWSQPSSRNRCRRWHMSGFLISESSCRQEPTKTTETV